MNLKTHLDISEILIESLTRISDETLNPFWFKLGSIMPDINLYYRVQPHHARGSRWHIEKLTKKIASGNLSQRKRDYFLGIITHFISDTFCLMHNVKRGKNLKNHARYENQLSRIFQLAFEPLRIRTANQNTLYQEASGRDLTDFILEENRRYRQLQQGKDDIASIATDMTYTLYMCMNVLTEVLTQQAALDKREESAA